MVELRQQVGRYITFSKQDVFKDLGSAIPEAQSWDMRIPQADSIASPTTSDVGATQHSSMETQGADDTIPPLPWHQSKAKIKDRGTPPADSTTSPAMANAEDTQPGLREAPPMDENTVPLAEPDAEAKEYLPTAQATSPAEDTKMQKDLLTAQATSLAKLESQVAPTAGLVNESSGLPTPSGHIDKEGPGVPALTASMEALKLEPPQWWLAARRLQ